MAHQRSGSPQPGHPVATDSDDPMQPMLFSFPGSAAPSEWPAERRGRLQRDGSWGQIAEVARRFPAGVRPPPR